MKFHAVFLFLLFTQSSLHLVIALQCYESSSSTVNYTVTSEQFPTLPDMVLKTAVQCVADITWEKNPLKTDIRLSAFEQGSQNNRTYDIVAGTVALTGDFFDLNVTKARRYLQYSCVSSDGCNNETTLKRVLESLVLEENFTPEFYSLIANVDSFNNNTAATCLRFSTMGDSCPTPSFADCHRCAAGSDRSSPEDEHVCAACDASKTVNGVEQYLAFILNNRTKVYDLTRIKCQKEGCNSMENINKIRQASTVTFDYDKFFNTSSTSTIFLSFASLFLALIVKVQLAITY